MKNNEILISAKFEGNGVSEELSFLVLKDITLKSLIQAVYYGLKKLDGHEKTFDLLTEYLQTRKELQVLYNSRGDFNVIDFTETADGKPVYDKALDELGIVTSTCLYFTLDTAVRPRALFRRVESSYILRSGDSLEYNISTRRLNVIESSVIDILPPGEMPGKDKGSILDVLIPTLLSTGGMLAARFLIMQFSKSAASMGDTMLLMSGAMGIVALVTSLYNYLKKKNEYKASVGEWKTNYENYIHRMISTIKEWQVSDIKYLNSMYPSMDTLFKNTAEINGALFSRSQNDNDFMRITLGTSDEVKPLFEIRSEKKDNIFYDIYYKKTGDWIQIRIPSKKEKKRRKHMTAAERAREDKNQFLLTDLPYVFANKGVDSEDVNEVVGFNYLRSDDGTKPPLLLDLRTSGVLGVVSNDDRTSRNFIQHIVFELAYYHSPEDLQFVFFFDREDDASRQNEVMKNYRYLPHANELFEGISQFVFDKNSSGLVFGQLLSIMNERGRNESEEGDAVLQKQTQIVCIVFDDYDIKETGFSKFLPEVPKEGEPYVNKNGLTFIFVQHEKEQLPKYCGNIVDIDKDNPNGRKSSLRYNILSRETLNVLSSGTDEAGKANDTDKLIEYKHFQNDYIFNEKVYSDRFSLAFRQLSAIYYTRIAENGKVPSMVTLFELYGYDNEKVNSGEVRKEILQNWTDVEKNDITKNLCVPIGKNEHGALNLDLYEKADGPHMLVAGTTGSGKSETIITYLIGLCMKFSPMDLNLMLVDMKGGGFSDRLGGLPHCVGAVTDTAGENEGTSAAYMLKRFLEALNAEIKRRKLLLSSLGVDNVDAYIRALRIMKEIKSMEGSPENIQAAEQLKRKLNEKQKEALKKDFSELVPLSHLVLVVDEFTELKRFSAESSDVDFIAEITTIARVGRTLGFHIILVSQNIEGAITDDIRVNSKARICLKVATKQASKEMIDSPAAAAPGMPLNGRAYLLVGTGSRFEYFQSAYTGANRNLNVEPPVLVTQVTNSGKFNTDFYSSRRDNELEKKNSAQVSEHDTQLAYIVNTITDIGKEMERPRQIFLPPLPERMADTTEWRN
ncbi:MAG TPA: cell division protein FtsK [Candidatus Mediterraneibacter norwichensis]|nr:cell division protein FtsK [Candidatus Mediterraneibacter norwichensis]